MITENSKSFEEFHGAARANRMNSRVSNNPIVWDKVMGWKYQQ